MKVFRAGALQVAVWENQRQNEDGELLTFTTISFERRYKDRNTEEWRGTANLSPTDLPKASLLLNKAYEYLVMNAEPERPLLEAREERVG